MLKGESGNWREETVKLYNVCYMSKILRAYFFARGSRVTLSVWNPLLHHGSLKSFMGVPDTPLRGPVCQYTATVFFSSDKVWEKERKTSSLVLEVTTQLQHAVTPLQSAIIWYSGNSYNRPHSHVVCPDCNWGWRMTALCTDPRWWPGARGHTDLGHRGGWHRVPPWHGHGPEPLGAQRPLTAKHSTPPFFPPVRGGRGG